MHNRSIKCCIWRTLPGQVYSFSVFNPDSVSRADVPKSLIRSFDKMLREQRNVAVALAQRRHFDSNNRQPVPKILTKFPVLNELMQIPVGSRDHAHIDLSGSRRADRTYLPLLKKSQKLQLKALVNFADLIQEDRSVIRRLKDTDPVPVRPCVGAAHGAEEFTFDQSRRDGSAIDRQ